MSNNIKISPKHGLNPCMPLCVFCGQEKGEVAILGKLKNDAEAPMYAVIDYQPCETCQNNWSQGVALIRVTEKQPQKGMPPISVNDGHNLYPEGGYIVITEETAKRIFDMDFQNGQPVMVEDIAFDRLIENAKKSGVLDEN